MHCACSQRATRLFCLWSVCCLGWLATLVEGLRVLNIPRPQYSSCSLFNRRLDLWGAVLIIHLSAHRSGFLIRWIDEVEPQPAGPLELR